MLRSTSVAVLALSIVLAACSSDAPLAPATPHAPSFTTNAPILHVGDSTILSVSAQTTSWATSDPAVLEVRAIGHDSAMIRARAAGSALVVANTDAGQISSDITVRPIVSGASLYPRVLNVATSDARPLVAIVRGRFATADTVATIGNGTGASLGGRWSVADSDVATIDSTGRVTGRHAGTTTATFTIDGVATSSTIVVAAAASHHYAIDTLFIGASDVVRQATLQASARWSRVIASDLPTLRFDLPAGMCSVGLPAVHRTVDDFLLVVRVDSIDGPGGAVASATPCLVRDDWTPSLGVVTIDAADLPSLVQSGRLADVITHEIGHTLGIGTLWIVRQLVNGWGSADPTFTGTSARHAAWELGVTNDSTQSLAVENEGGAGTANEHWRATSYSGELMTGWLSTSSASLSEVTVGALADMGYAVDATGAEPFVPSGVTPANAIGASLSRTNARPQSLGEKIAGPQFRLARGGTNYTRLTTIR